MAYAFHEGSVLARWKVILWIAFAATVVFAAVIAIVSVWISHQARDWVQGWLARQYQSDVELSSFKIAMPFPLVQAGGEGLIVHFQGRPDLPPLIAASRFTLRTSFWSLLRNPRRIQYVHIDGLQINIPPRGDDDPGTRNGVKKFMGNFRAARFGEIISEGAILKILTRKPGKDPLTFAIDHLNLHSTETDGQLAFRATLNNPKPPGQILSTGTFGPWNADVPSLTPVSGGYTLEHADLGVFRGIQGTLSSKGNYQGVLEEIHADGTTDIPNFQVTRAGHAIDLSTTFHATVDGTDGDTYLHPVEVHFLTTVLVCEGSMEGAAGRKGKTITLNVTAGRAQIEDLLQLAVKEAAPMRGPVRLKTKFILSPGPQDISDRLKLDGSFGLDSAYFTSAPVQQELDNMSKRSLGKPKEVRLPEDATKTDDVATAMNGHFRLENATLTLSSVGFEIPGAKVQLHGSYKLAQQNLDLHGTLAMQAKLSQTTTGVKSFFLKLFDPVFYKNGKGTRLPIKITGSLKHVSYGADFGRKETSEKAQK